MNVYTPTSWNHFATVSFAVLMKHTLTTWDFNLQSSWRTRVRNSNLVTNTLISVWCCAKFQLLTQAQQADSKSNFPVVTYCFIINTQDNRAKDFHQLGEYPDTKRDVVVSAHCFYNLSHMMRGLYRNISLEFSNLCGKGEFFGVVDGERDR